MRAAARVFGAEATARLAGDLGGSSASPNLATGAGGSLAARVAAASYGIAARTYRVRTADGYLLRLVRLPRVESSRVAYFQHGLLDSASAWVASGAMYGLAVRAWAQGFDVFLGNLRGTEDSNDRDDAHAAASVQAQEGVAPAPSAQHSESERGDPRRGTGFSAENKAWPRSLGVPGSQSGWSFEAEAEADGGDDGGAAGLAGAAHGQDGPALVEGVHGDHGQVARLASPAGVTVPCAVPPRAELAKVEASGSPARGSSKGQTWTAAEPAGRALQPPAGVAIAPELGRGDGSDLRLGHSWLARSSTAFWQYSVDDHTLDVMAHIDAVRDLKAADAPLRREAAASRRRSRDLARAKARSARRRADTVRAEARSRTSPSAPARAPRPPGGTASGAAWRRLVKGQAAGQTQARRRGAAFAASPDGGATPEAAADGDWQASAPAEATVPVLIPESDEADSVQEAERLAREAEEEAAAATREVALVGADVGSGDDDGRAARSETSGSPRPAASPHRLRCPTDLPRAGWAGLGQRAEGASASSPPLQVGPPAAPGTPPASGSGLELPAARAPPPVHGSPPAVRPPHATAATTGGPSAATAQWSAPSQRHQDAASPARPSAERVGPGSASSAADDAASATEALAAILGGRAQAVPDGLGSAAGEEPSKDAATRAASDASASGGAAGQGWGASAEPPAYSASLSDVAIVGVGHSMGGCLMLTHVLHSRALRRPHGMCGTVLLSPAGLHRDVGVLPRVVLSLTGLVALRLVPDGPFPMRSSKLQQVVAGIVQDLKRSQGTGDLIAAVASIFFGGTSGGFAFRRISLFDYPLGGTSVRVMAHGCQGMFGSEMTPFSFGEEENLRRYGTRAPESYRHDFGLLDVPMAFAAGELDALIPPANVRLLAAAVEAASPGKSGYEGFSQLGHLDFTLGVSDEVISHVLARLDSFTRAAADSRVKALPDFPLDLEAEIADDARLRSVASVARNRNHAGVSPSNWLPAAECARQYPFLNCYMKREVAFRGLDRRRARLWDAFDAKANAMPSLAGPSAGSPGAS